MKQKNNKKQIDYLKEINLGLANIKSSNLKISENHFKKAIEIDKENHTAYLNLSNIYILQNKIENALYILSHYLDNFDFNEHIINHLGKILLKHNFNYKLNKLFLRYKLEDFQLDQKKYFLYFLRGKYFEDLDIEKSIKNYEFSISCNRNFKESYFSLFRIFERLNHLEKFQALFKKIQINHLSKEDNIKILFYKSLFLNRSNKYKESESLIKINNFENYFKNINFYYPKLLDVVSKNNEKLKNYSASFQAIKKRNIYLKAQSKGKFDRVSLINTIKTYRDFYRVNKINTKIFKKENKSKNLVFLVGFPRSGTTMLDSILRSHSKTVVLEEKPYLLNIRHNFFKQNNNSLESLKHISKENIQQIRNKYFSEIELPRTKKNFTIIDKFPLTIIELGFIKIIFPEAKIILALRHPCDVVLSCYFSRFQLNEAMINFLSWNDTLNFYNNVFQLFETYEKQIELNYYKIKYENIINNFKKEITNLLKFLNLEYEVGLEKFFDTAKKRKNISTPSYSQVINPLYKTSINRWINFNNYISSESNLEKWIKKFDY